ncbi:MAG: ABC transporter transmembrane domain-containing protein [Actinomycetota bacterium]
MTDQVDDRRTIFVRGLRIIRGYIATHPLPFTISVTGAAVYAGATVGSTVVLGRVTDDVVIPAFRDDLRTGALIAGVVAVLAVGAIKALGIVFRRYFAGMTSARVQRTLRSRIVDRYQELPLAYHRAHPTGELIAHAEADVEAATDVLNPLPFSTAVVLLAIFAVISLLLTDAWLALIGFAILPTLAILNRRYTRKAEDPAIKAQQKVGEVSSVAHESFDGALVVKTLGREDAEVARLAVKARELRDQRIRLGKMRAAFEPSFEALPNLGIILLLAVGAWRVSNGSISPRRDRPVRQPVPVARVPDAIDRLRALGHPTRRRRVRTHRGCFR